MYNEKVFHGADGILTLSDPQGLSEDDFSSYFGETGLVGRVTNVSVSVTTHIQEFYELGSHSAKDLRAGNIRIAGSVERAFINGALLKLMLGEYAVNEAAGAFRIPSFNMKLMLNNINVEGDEGNSVLTIYGAIFDSMNLSVPEEDFVLEKLTFKAKRIKSDDVEVAA